MVDTHGLRHCGTLIVVFVSASMLGSATGEINGFIGAKGVNGYIRLKAHLSTGQLCTRLEFSSLLLFIKSFALFTDISV